MFSQPAASASLFSRGSLAMCLLMYCHSLLTETIPAEAQPELGTWGDGRGEDELSPEEIQMVTACSADSLLFHAVR